MNEDCNYLLRLMLEIKEPNDYSLISYKLGGKRKDMNLSGALAELERLNIFITGYDNRGDKTYLLKEPIRRELSGLSSEYDERPYDYLLEKEARHLEEESKSKWYTTENARTQFENYPQTRKMAILAFWISVASFIATVLLKLLK